jgi:hypothetical protein
MRGLMTVFPHRGLPPHQSRPMSGAHQPLHPAATPRLRVWSGPGDSDAGSAAGASFPVAVGEVIVRRHKPDDPESGTVYDGGRGT